MVDEWPDLANLPEFKNVDTQLPKYEKKGFSKICPRLNPAGLDLLAVITLSKFMIHADDFLPE